MKTFNLFAASLFLLSQNAAAQAPSAVRVKPGFATVIVCPVPPELVTVGNTEQFTTQSAGNYILVKPVVSQGSTNMFIKAGPDSYNLLLQVSDHPDLEVRLQATAPSASVASGARNGTSHAGEATEAPAAKSAAAKSPNLKDLSQRSRAMLASYLKTPRPYTYSVVNSGVVFAVDHMAMIEEKLFVIGTLVNNSRIPYDIGFVRFRLVENARSLLLFKKRVKEEELEPLQEAYTPRVEPNSSTRMLFVFDKHGFSDRSDVEIKCTEESGRRDLVLKVPGSFVE